MPNSNIVTRRIDVVGRTNMPVPDDRQSTDQHGGTWTGRKQGRDGTHGLLVGSAARSVIEDAQPEDAATRTSP
jgi:hypothetical protein